MHSLTDKEIRRLYDVAYIHCREELGYFPKPRLHIITRTHRRLGNFYHIQREGIYANSRSREPMYESLKHECVHAYLDYSDVRHRGIFTECARKVGAIYAR